MLSAGPAIEPKIRGGMHGALRYTGSNPEFII